MRTSYVTRFTAKAPRAGGGTPAVLTAMSISVAVWLTIASVLICEPSASDRRAADSGPPDIIAARMLASARLWRQGIDSSRLPEAKAVKRRLCQPDGTGKREVPSTLH